MAGFYAIWGIFVRYIIVPLNGIFVWNLGLLAHFAPTAGKARGFQHQKSDLNLLVFLKLFIKNIIDIWGQFEKVMSQPQLLMGTFRNKQVNSERAVAVG